MSQVTLPLAECHGEQLPDLSQSSLWEMFANTASRYPSHDAVVSLWQQVPHPKPLHTDREQDQEGELSHTPSSATRWTYADLVQRVESLAGWLESRGCTKGDKLVALLWNSSEWALFFWVAARLRMSFVPLDPRVAETGIENYIRMTVPKVLVAQDSAATSAMQPTSQEVRIKIICSNWTELDEGWTCLSDTINSAPPAATTLPGNDPTNAGADIALIVFTSGTTSTPKGCPHTASNLWSSSSDFDPDSTLECSDRWLVHTPVWHIMAVNNALRTWRYGGSVVLASKSFDITASLQALEKGQCTRMGVVPTLTKAMLEHPAFPGKEALSLKYISIGGTIVTEEDFKMCDGFGSSAVSKAYGMSEGAPVTGWRRNHHLLKTGFYPGVGHILPGCRMRVCTPGTKELLRRNEVGELHIGGTTVIESYLGGVQPNSFYEDESGSWCVTGDQAFIDQNDILHINGRLKDLIIRGGTNIAPAPIEDCLGRNSLVAQVIGAPDEIAGEVLVAVVQSLGHYSKAQIYELVKPLGSTYALDSILTLDELELEAFPTTITGKISKEILRQRVREFMNENELTDSLPTPPDSKRATPEPSIVGSDQASIDAIAERLRAIWLEIGTVHPETNDPVTEYSDSITMLRFCNIVARRLRKRIYLPDLLTYRTIEQQAEFLYGQDGTHKRPTLTRVQETEGPPSLDDVVLANNDIHRFDLISAIARKTLNGLGLSWEKDVEGVLPIRDSFRSLAQGPRPQSFQHRMLYQLQDQSPSALRQALETCLSSHLMFRTILAQLPDNSPFHMIGRPGKTLYDLLITERRVPTKAVVDEMHQKGSENFLTAQMFQAIIISVEDLEPSTLFLMITYNHSVFDAISMVLWNRDLEAVLLDPEAEILPQTSFKLFADLMYAYESSRPAMANVEYFANRLRGISKFSEALWPRQRGPGWMCGDDRGSEHYEVRMKLRQEQSQAVQSTRGPTLYLPRVMKTLNCPDMEILKLEHQLKPSNVVKTAIALFNVQQTGKEYAIFNNMDSGRDWPFLLPWMKRDFPSAMSIDGPTIEHTLNMLQILPDETIGSLLQRISEDQRELSRHCHAPQSKVLENLGEEAPAFIEASKRQCFNWDISLQYVSGYKKEFMAMTPLGRQDWPDCGIYWLGGMLNEEDLCIAATFDDVHLSLPEVDGHVTTLLDIVGRLASPVNWDLTVCHVFRS